MSDIVVDPETPESELAAQQSDNQTPPPENDIPEKYRGKSLKDIIAMHQNAESELGRKNNEVGVIRKLADELIGVRSLERQANRPEPRKPITSDDILTNPEEKILEVVREATETNAQAQAERLSRLEASLQVQEFEKRHPGFQTTMQSNEFGSWLQNGTDYRKGLALKAAQGDFGAADELFGLYKEHTAAAPAQAEKQEKGDPLAAARAAGTVRSGGSHAAGVVPSSNDKKVWSRTDLLDMRINRPDEFDARQDEILKAYAENRVR